MNDSEDRTVFTHITRFATLLATIAVLAATTGCSSAPPALPDPMAAQPDYSIVLKEGDVVKVTFAGAPNLNTTQQIRRDGNIAMPLAGDLKAAGLTPSQLEKAILDLYGDQLVTKEVTVALDSAQFPVFVTGAVLRPGKILSDKPITALEAIMEAGGFDYTRANTRSVLVIRHEGKYVRNFKLNLKEILEGKTATPFYLKPSDIVYVKERVF